MKQKNEHALWLSAVTLTGLAACGGGGGGTVAPAAASLDVNDLALAEGDDGTTFFDFVVALSEPRSAPVSVDFVTADGSAQDEAGDADYQAVSGTLTFDPGTTSQVVRVLVNGDIRLEGDESFSLLLSGAAGPDVAIGKGQGVGTILGDEVVAFSVEHSSAMETDSLGGALEFSVRLAAQVEETLSVDFTTADGSARGDFFAGDYRPTTGTLVFDPGVTEQTVAVELYGDFEAEIDETFSLQLSNPQGLGSTLADSFAIGTIFDDDTELHLDGDPLAPSQRPQLASAGGYLYAAWHDGRNGAPDIYFRRSADGGETWSENPRRLDTGVPGLAASTEAQIAAEGADVYVAWQDARDGATDVYLNWSNDSGASWQAADVRVDTNGLGATTSSQVRLAVSGGKVYVAWVDARNGAGDVYFNYSHDGGATWQVNDLRLDTDAPGTTSSSELQLAADGDRVLAAWVDNGNIFANASSDGGATWLPAQVRVDRDPSLVPNIAGAPRIALEDTNVYVAWQDARDGASDIYLNQSFDGGASFGPFDRRLDAGDLPGANSSTAPSLAADGLRVYVAWQENRQPWASQDDIYVNVSSDGGITWAGERRLDHGDTPGRTQSQQPVVACDGETVAVVWSDRRNGPALDLFVSSSTDGGASFLSRIRRIDTDLAGSADSRFPDVLVDGAQVQVVWQDERFGGDVFFKAFPAQ